jgi:site-specific DNA recombinase
MDSVAQEVYDLYGRESPSNAAGRAEDEGRETPFDTQFAEMRARVADKGGRVGVERRDVWWRDDIWGRPGLDDIRQRIREHKTDVLLVHSVERLATKKQLGYLLAECELHGVRVEYVHGLQFDPGDPAGAIIQAAYEFAADWEHARIRERTQRGLRTLLATGRPVGTGRVRYGLQWRTVPIPGRTPDTVKQMKVGYDAHPEHGKVVARLFARAFEGATERAQVKELHDLGIPSPTGREWWTPHVIGGILRDRLYTGVAENLRWKRTKARKEKGGRMRSTVSARPEEERQLLPAGTAPPLVDDGVFDAVQRIVQKNRAESSRRARWPDATALRGVAFCANCGRRLYVHPVPEKRGGLTDGRPSFVLRCIRSRNLERDSLPAGPWKCPGWTHADDLEAEVWAALLTRLDEPAVRAQAAEAPDVAAKERGDVDAIAARMARLERDIALRERQLKATDPEAEPESFALFKADLERFRGEHAEAAKERDDREAALAAARADATAWEDIRERWRDALRALPSAERARAYRALRVRVRVWPDDPAARPGGAPRWEADVDLTVAGLRAVVLKEGDGAGIVDPIRGYSDHNTAPGAPGAPGALPLALRPAG